MAISSHLTTHSITGTPTLMTDAAMTSLGSNRFQVTNALHRVLSPEHAVSVSDTGAPLAADAYTVDYLFGIVTLDAPPSGAVTITARYVPLLVVAESRSAEIACTREEFPLNYAGNDFVDIAMGRKSATVSLDVTRLTSEAIDSGDTAEEWEALHSDGTPKLLSINIGGSGRYFRCWGILPGLPQSAPESGVISGAREFQSIARPALGRSEVVSFGFGE